MNHRNHARKAFLTLSVLLFTGALTLLPAAAQRTPTRGLATTASSVVRTASGEEVKLYDASYALVIGGSSYARWPALPGVKRDVEKVKGVLEKSGFQVTTLMNPTLVDFDRAMRDFIDARGQSPGNRLVIYFAGHGWTVKADDGRLLGYIVPSDAPLPTDGGGHFISRAIQFMQIEMYAGQIQSRHALFLFDSCFSGSLLEANRGLSVPPLLADMVTRPVREYITAGTADQPVSDESVFCDQFVEGLGGGADLNRDGYVTGSELGMFLEERVTHYTKGMQTPRWGKIRNQYLDKGDIVFPLPRPQATPGPRPTPPPPTAKVDELRLWIKVSESRDLKDIEAYLRQYPEGEHAAEARSRMAATHFDLGQKFHEEGQPIEAEPHLLAGLRLDPESVRGHLLLGSFYFGRRRLAEAKNEFAAALRAEPDNVEANYRMGAVLKESYERAEAEAQLRKALGLADAALGREPNSPALHAFKSGILHCQGDFAGEEAEARTVLRLDPKDMRGYERLGAALMAQRKWSEVEKLYRAALLLKPNGPRWHSSLGYVLAEQGKFKEAEPELRLAIQLDPKGGQYHINLGVALSKQNRWDEAEAAYLRAIEVDPENAGLLHHVAHELSARKKYAEAEPFYRRAAQYDPTRAERHAEVGKNLLQQQKYAEAEVAFREAVRLDANNSDYRDQLRKVRQKLGVG
jgi:tetratricopeptide (TPR) repeat protein